MSTAQTELDPLAREALAAQPFSTLIGAELAAIAPGFATLRIPIRGDLLQQHGFVHGGVLAYAADNAITFAGGTVLGPNVVTADVTIHYVRPAKGTALRVEARVTARRRRRAVCACEVYAIGGDDGEQLCATATGSVALVEVA